MSFSMNVLFEDSLCKVNFLSIILDKNSYILSNIIDKMVPLFAGIVFDVRVKGYKKPPTGFERAVGGVHFKKIGLSEHHH